MNAVNDAEAKLWEECRILSLANGKSFVNHGASPLRSNWSLLTACAHIVCLNHMILICRALFQELLSIQAKKSHQILIDFSSHPVQSNSHCQDLRVEVQLDRKASHYFHKTEKRSFLLIWSLLVDPFTALVHLWHRTTHSWHALQCSCAATTLSSPHFCLRSAPLWHTA